MPTPSLPPLLPCPHCGSSARRHRYRDDGARFYFDCSNAECHHTFTDEQEAAAAWNKRVVSADSKELAEIKEVLWPNQTGLPNEHRNAAVAVKRMRELAKARIDELEGLLAEEKIKRGQDVKELNDRLTDFGQSHLAAAARDLEKLRAVERERDRMRTALEAIAANPGAVDDNGYFASGSIAKGVLAGMSAPPANHRLAALEQLWTEMCEATKGLDDDGMENWHGHFMPFNELIAAMARAGIEGYSQDPMELVSRLVNERDELKAVATWTPVEQEMPESLVPIIVWGVLEGEDSFASHEAFRKPGQTRHGITPFSSVRSESGVHLDIHHVTHWRLMPGDPAENVAPPPVVPLAALQPFWKAIGAYIEYHGGCEHHPDDCAGKDDECKIVAAVKAAELPLRTHYPELWNA